MTQARFTPALSRVALITACVLASLLSGLVRAQQPESQHAWLVIPAAKPAPTGDTEASPDSDDSPEPAILLHAPPRVPTDMASPAPSLRLARVALISQMPDAIVPVGDEVYCVFPPDSAGERPVGHARTFPRGLRDLWGYSPSRRLGVFPAIPATDAFLAAGTDGDTLVVLVDREGTRRLIRLEPGGWEDSDALMPLDGQPSFGLASRRGEICIAAIREGQVSWLQQSEDGWVGSEPAVPAGLAGSLGTARVIGAWRDEVIAISSGDEVSGIGVLAISRSDVRFIGHLPVGADASFGIVGDRGVLIAAQDVGATSEDVGSGLATPGVSASVPSVVEFSLISGRVLAKGNATTSSPVSRDEFQALAILLFGCMIAVLLVVVRPPPAGPEPVLPPGTAIAPSGRRALATVIDLVPAVVIAARVLGLSQLEVLGPLALPLTGSVDVLPLAFVLTIAASHCAVGEMLFGRSLGKSFTGIFVARVDPLPGAKAEPGRFRPPTPAGAVVRNLLKWFLFPATAIVLSDPSGRHRGDLIARAAVLTPVRAQD